MSELEDLRVEVADGVAVLTLDRPDSLNAFSGAMGRSLTAALRDCVQAVNVTDSAGAHMTLAPLAACHLLLDHGIEPILQLTSRDRNRIALQGDMPA